MRAGWNWTRNASTSVSVPSVPIAPSVEIGPVSSKTFSLGSASGVGAAMRRARRDDGREARRDDQCPRHAGQPIGTVGADRRVAGRT